MSNYLGRKTDFTPSVYTRYFERPDTRKQSNGHIYFDDNEEQEQVSNSYQLKRDLLFKRIFPSKYADQNNNDNNEQTTQNGNNTTQNSASQSLGDYISLSNNTSSNRQPSSPLADIVLSSSDEHDSDDDLLIEDQTPTIPHASIVGHVHPRSVIENVRAVLIREFYQRTSDSHTEWLKCKMNLPRDYINPKYYADFQRRYKREIERYSNHSKKNKRQSHSNSTKSDDKIKRTNSTSENDHKIKPLLKSYSDSSSSSPPEYIVLQSDDDDDEQSDNINSTYFIDRSAKSLSEISTSHSTSNDDYSKEDSKYAQLPARNNDASTTIIRPIISKHQRRKKATSTKPLVSAIDRIIDHMDESPNLDDTQTIEQKNLLVKQIKKRKKKKQKKKKQLNANSTD